MSFLSALRPWLSTLAIFVALVLMWIPIVTDFYDVIEEISDALAVVFLFVSVFASFGLIGLYGAITVTRGPAIPPSKGFLALVVLRSSLLAGAAVGLVVLLGD
jgi:hypothetical protein